MLNDHHLMYFKMEYPILLRLKRIAKSDIGNKVSTQNAIKFNSCLECLELME